MSKFHLIVICILSLTVAACSGGGGGGSAKTITGTSTSYSSDGATQIITTTYSDGTTSTTNYAPLSTSYSYSADGSQKIPVYTFANGATNNGPTLTGTLTTPVYSPDGSQKTLRYSFSDGTTNNGTTLTGTPSDPVYSGSQLSYKYSFSDGSKSPTQTLDISTKSSESFSSDGTTKTVTYTLGNEKQVSFTLAGTAGTATYKADGSEKYIPYSYTDSTTHTATLTGTLTSPKYSANFLQKTLVYSFNDGTTHDGSTINGHADTPQFSADGSEKTPVYRYDDGTQYFGATLNGTLTTAVYSSDGSQKTLVYLFSDGTTNNGATLTGTKTNPLSDAAVYPSNWTTTGTVTKPVTHALFYSFSDQTTYTVEDGSQAKPFSQSNLTPNGAAATGAINDPNAYVSFTADAKPVNNNTPTQMTFDLHWGTPDPAGPGYAKNYFNQTTGKYDTNYKLPSSTFIFRAWLTSSGLCSIATSADPNCGATLSPPSDDIIAAWNNGWTGKDTNILIWDSIGASPLSTHPAIVQTISYRYAPGAKFYGMSWSASIPGIPQNTVLNLDGTLTSTATPIEMDAINMSFGANLTSYLGAQPVGGWTQLQLLTARAAYSGFSTNANLLTNTAYQSAFNFQSAVVVKSAGNDAIDAQYEPLNWYLAQNTDVLGRLLIVGALNQLGTTTNKATLATYSNTAGADPTIQSRFLVESGRVAYADGANAYGGNPLYGSSADGNSGSVGTSFAAPRVAGYVTIVRQKFPNLTAPNTADIMLATARYDTLTCYPNCDKSIYGQGEASLSRALAPVGYLR